MSTIPRRERLIVALDVPAYDDARWLVVGVPASRTTASAPLGAFDVLTGSMIVGRVHLRAPVGPGTGELVGWQLTPRSIPPMDETVQRLTAVRRVEGIAATDSFLRGTGDLVVPPRTRASVLLDQTHTTNAYPVLTTSGGAASRVTLTYAEALVDAQGAKGNRNEVEGRTMRGVHDVFRPDGGAHRVFEPLYWRSFRYIQLDIETAEQALVVHDVHGVAVEGRVRRLVGTHGAPPRRSGPSAGPYGQTMLPFRTHRNGRT